MFYLPEQGPRSKGNEDPSTFGGLVICVGHDWKWEWLIKGEILVKKLVRVFRKAIEIESRIEIRQGQ